MTISRQPGKSANLYLNLTTACNSACLFCVSSSQNIVIGQDIPVEKILTAFEQLEIGQGDEVILNGGEPTIYSGLVELVREAAGRDAKVFLATNGRLLHRYDYADNLLTAGVFRLSIPLHGYLPETHDTMTARSGSLKQTLTGIRNAYSIRTKTNYPKQIELKLLALRSVLPEWSAIIDYIVQEFNFSDTLVLSGLNMWSTAVDTYKEVTPTLSQLRYYLNEALVKAETYGINLVLWAIPLCILEQEKLEKYVTSACTSSSGVFDDIQTIYFDHQNMTGIELVSNEFEEAAVQEPCIGCELIELCGPGSKFMQQIVQVSN